MHCAAPRANGLSTLWERILFVFLKFDEKQTQANTPKGKIGK